MSSTPDNREDYLQKVVEVMGEEVFRRFIKCGGIGDFTLVPKKSDEDSRDTSVKQSSNENRDDLLQKVVEVMGEEVFQRFKKCGGIGDFTLVSKDAEKGAIQKLINRVSKTFSKISIKKNNRTGVMEKWTPQVSDEDTVHNVDDIEDNNNEFED